MFSWKLNKLFYNVESRNIVRGGPPRRGRRRLGRDEQFLGSRGSRRPRKAGEDPARNGARGSGTKACAWRAKGGAGSEDGERYGSVADWCRDMDQWQIGVIYVKLLWGKMVISPVSGSWSYPLQLPGFWWSKKILAPKSTLEYVPFGSCEISSF